MSRLTQEQREALARELLSDDLISRHIIKEQMLRYEFTSPYITVTEFVDDYLPSAQPDGDLISKQAAIQEIKDLPDCQNGYSDTYDKAQIIGVLEELPSAKPEPCWIPCSERLPVQNGVYVVTRTISDGFEYGNITDCCYFDGTNTWHDDTRVNHGRKYLADVIAWQPLPEPYKAEE